MTDQNEPTTSEDDATTSEGEPRYSTTSYEEMAADDVTKLAPFTLEMVDAVKDITSSLAFIIAEDHASGFLVGAGEDGETVMIGSALRVDDEPEPGLILVGLGLRATNELAKAINRAARETAANGMRKAVADLMENDPKGLAAFLVDLVEQGAGVIIMGGPDGDKDAADGEGD